MANFATLKLPKSIMPSEEVFSSLWEWCFVGLKTQGEICTKILDVLMRQPFQSKHLRSTSDQQREKCVTGDLQREIFASELIG